jgi:hypothetical protein
MDIKMNFGIDGQDLDSLLTPKNAGVYSFKSMAGPGDHF